jgi:hypothetical protein
MQARPPSWAPPRRPLPFLGRATRSGLIRMIVWRLSSKSRRAVADAIAVGERAAAMMSERLAQEASSATGSQPSDRGA